MKSSCHKSFVLGAALCTILYLAGSAEAAVTCYICSWSRQGSVFNSSNVKDVCTTNNFESEAARAVECQLGCESVAKFTRQNGELVHFHRNCISGDANAKDRCQDRDAMPFFETRCTCLSSYCNSSPSILASWGLTLITVFGLLHF